MKQKSCRLIVGIPSYNEADSISYVVEQIDKGLVKYFSESECEIVNVDNNSPDNTKEVFLSTKTKIPKKYITTPKGIKGKGNNFYNLFKYARETGADGVIVVDADLKSINPEWMLRLGTPILKGVDFVTPLYIRHKYDGTITNSLVFPIVYSLINKNIRQPIGGDFAISKRLVAKYLEQDWDETTRQYGIDIFMTMNALIGDFSVEQVMLDAKIHKPSGPKLGPMFVQVVNTLFDILTSNKKILKEKGGGKPKEHYTLPDIDPPEVDVDPEEIKQNAIQGFSENKLYLENIIDSTVFSKINEVFAKGKPEISADLWSEIVFEFLVKYEKMEDKIKLIEAFKCLYMVRTHSFIEQTKDKSSLEAEKITQEQAKTFWTNKHLYLEG